MAYISFIAVALTLLLIHLTALMTIPFAFAGPWLWEDQVASHPNQYGSQKNPEREKA